MVISMGSQVKAARAIKVSCLKLTPAGLETVIYSFAGGPDPADATGLTMANDGTLYGTSLGGGANQGGTVFTVTPAGVETVLYSFPGRCYIVDPSVPYPTCFSGGPPSGLILGSDGNFYGATGNPSAEINNGTVFRITPAGALTVLYAFTAGADGANPTGLIQGNDGNFYGTTAGVGNSQGEGPYMAFQVTPAGGETTLYTFPNTVGPVPSIPCLLIKGNDGSFYGCTEGGGATGNGAVFKLTTGGESTLYSFTGGSDGNYPSDLIQGSDGNFYGLVAGDSSTINPGLFVLTPAGVETLLYSFSAQLTTASLLQARDGHLYGLVQEGPYNYGAVFRF
jgi:uncharacterized repeat protein (TIGR03803 family)